MAPRQQRGATPAFLCDRNIPPGKIPTRRLQHYPMKSMHLNNVIWLCTKDDVDTNLFRLESSILTQTKREGPLNPMRPPFVNFNLNYFWLTYENGMFQISEENRTINE